VGHSSLRIKVVLNLFTWARDESVPSQTSLSTAPNCAALSPKAGLEELQIVIKVNKLLRSCLAMRCPTWRMSELPRFWSTSTLNYQARTSITQFNDACNGLITTVLAAGVTATQESAQVISPEVSETGPTLPR